jgi:hypothetical protein
MKIDVLVKIVKILDLCNKPYSYIGTTLYCLKLALNIYKLSETKPQNQTMA